VLRKYNLSIPQEAINATDELCSVISEVYSSVEREIYITEAAKRLKVDPRSVKADVDRKIYQRKASGKKKEGELARQTLSGYGDSVNPDFVRMPKIARAEETVLGLLQIYPEHRAAAFASPPMLTEEDFKTEFGKRVFSFIRTSEENGGFYAEMLDSEFTPDEVGRITKMRVSRMQLSDNGKAVFEDALRMLKDAANEERLQSEPLSADALLELLKRKRETEPH